jgi:hypothetical protein
LLVVIYSYLLVVLIGCGGLLGRAVLRGTTPRVFSRMALGISLLHALTLTGLPLVGVLIVVSAMAAVEGGIALRRPRAPVSPRALGRIALIFASALPLWAFYLSRPLWAFDPRIVWFFAGRVMFESGHFPLDIWGRLICHWGPDYYLNTNADYPKLIGSLAASVATLAGYWNEYLPKIATLLLHTLELIGFIELGWRRRAVALNVIITIVPTYRYFFDAGLLDIHVSLLTLIAILCFVERTGPASVRAQGNTERLDLLAMGVAAMAVASQLKFEGRALVLIVFACALVTRVVTPRALVRVAGVFVAFVPTVMWLAEVKLFKATGYLQHSKGLPIALVRLHHELMSVIVPRILTERLIVTGVGAIIVALVAARLAAPNLALSTVLRDRRFLLALLVGAGYAASLVVVYLFTSYPSVLEHIISSLSRADMPAQMGFFAAAMVALQMARQSRAAPPISSSSS